MQNQQKYFWDLFCATGEPRYYSMFVQERERNARNRPDLNGNDD